MSVLELGPTAIVLASGAQVWGADFRDRTLALVAEPIGNECRATLPHMLFNPNRPRELQPPTELIVLGAGCERPDVTLAITVDGRTTTTAGPRLVLGVTFVMPVHVMPGQPFALQATGPVPFTLYLYTLIKLSPDGETALQG